MNKILLSGTLCLIGISLSLSAQSDSIFHDTVKVVSVKDTTHIICEDDSIGLSRSYPAGNTSYYPILVSNIPSTATHQTYSNTVNTTEYSNNYMGQSTNDVYYCFTLPKEMVVTLTHNNSSLTNTCMYLLNSTLQLLISNDDYYGEGQCYYPTQSYIHTELSSGTYYVVCEGKDINGSITTNMIFDEIPVGDTSSNPIVCGSYSNSFSFSDTLNTGSFSNRMGLATNDVYYRFTLSARMNVTITNEGSSLSDTYLYLLNASGSVITSNDNYHGVSHCSDTCMAYINRQLSAGTYYIVTEGKNDNGIITTNITGNTSSGFGYNNIPSSYSTQPGTAVGSMGTSFGVSPTGGATSSVPIEVPVGVGGFQPQLSIMYNSQSGNGLCGYGAGLSGLSSIIRAPKDIYHDGMAQGMNYLANDALYLDGVRLILDSQYTPGQDGAIYYPESDPFTRVIAHGTCTSSANNIWFEVQTSNGMVYWYGYSQDSRLSYTVGNSQRIHSWYICRAQQPIGNYISYSYNQYDNCLYPCNITYGNNSNHANTLSNVIEFGYESRSDSVPIRFDGKLGSMKLRLKTITSKTNNNTFRSYTLNYNTTSDGSTTKFSRLTSITEQNTQNEQLPVTQYNWSYLPSVSYSPNNISISQPNLSNPFVSFPYSGQHFMSGDYNGDGLCDMVGIGTVGEPNNQNGYDYYTYVYFYYASLSSTGTLQFLSGTQYVLPPEVETGSIKGGMSNLSVADIEGDGINELVIPFFVSGSSNGTLGLYVRGQNFTNSDGYGATSLYGNTSPLFVSEDLDNDGRTDVAFLETTMHGGSYPLYIWKYNPDYIPGSNNVDHALFDMSIETALSLDSKPKSIITADMNGNGLNDLFVICEDGYAILWNQGGGLNVNTFSNTLKSTGTSIKSYYSYSYGDFNGDGLQDMIAKESMSTWYFYLNNGNGSFTKTMVFYNNVSTPLNSSLCHCDILDFDGDGKSDVVITEPTLNYPNGSFQHTDTYWMRSTGIGLVQVYHATSARETDALSSRFISGDFDGDGRVELVNYGYDCVNGNNADGDPVWRVYKNSNLAAQSGKVISVTGDYGATTGITYSTLTDQSVYTRGTADPYPAPKYSLPLNVVKHTVQDNGAAGALTTQYAYEGLKVHLKGRGMLGFSKTTANCTTTGVQTQSGITKWDTAHYIPMLTYSTTTIGTSTATTTNTLSIVDTYNTDHKVYFAYPSQTVSTDMDGYTTTAYHSYNTQKGYITSDSTLYDAGMYHAINYLNYTENKVGGIYRPQTITVRQKHSDDTSPFSRTTSYTYNSTTGSVSTKVENYGTSKPLTTTYTYNAWGNLNSQTVSANGITSLTTYYEYDITHRFPVRVHSYPWSSVQKYTYDVWGNVLTERDSINSSINNTITYTYDSWGNLIRTQIPGSGEVTYTYGWNGDASQRWYVLVQGTSRPWVKTWFDNRGREVKTESVGPKDVTVNSTITYNNEGLVAGRTDRNGNLTLSYSYTYDARARLTYETGPGNHTVGYQYGNRSVTVTENGNNSTTKTFDAWGNLKTLTAPVSGLTNTYASNGGIKSTVSGGATWTFGYDDRGNRTSLTDPDAGTTTYVYDALGRETSRTDGRGVDFVTNYDYLGRVTSRAANYDVTTYTFGTSGTGQMRVISESNDEWFKSFTYDTYGRLTQETMGSNMMDMNWTKTYQYNTAGLLTSRVYPGDRTVSYQYDAYGNCTKITSDIPYLEWNLTGYNGITTTSTLALPNNTSYSRITQLDSYGQLQSRITTRAGNTLQSDSYTFNPQTGNLTSRNVGSVPQSFSYDNVDRLTSIITGQEQISMTYAANGNITSKSDMGQYSYSSTTFLHTVTAVDCTGSIPYHDQWVYYNDWGKVDEIYYSNGSDYCYYEVEYGPDQERVFSYLASNNDEPCYKIQWGDYEEYHVGDVTEIYYWIEAPDGLAGVLRYTSDDYYNPYQSYVATTDHLGSLTALYDESGSKVHEAIYDAWGKRTLGQVSMPLVTRGYTGHEHLDELGLINMNGRLYDFNIGRFLSPDNFVQSPSNPQNYNRYSYCLNNPLKYTDPDGESVIALVGAILLATGWANVCIQHYNGSIYSFGDFFSAFVGGVAAGVSEATSWAFAFAELSTGSPFGVLLGHSILHGKSISSTTTSINSILHPINATKIILGRYYTDENEDVWNQALQGLSRFTWEGPQTWAGYNWSNIRSIAGKVDKIDYLGGATFCMNENGTFGSVSLGNYINADLDGSYEGSITKHPVLMHEYGHTFDSREAGPAYLFTIGIPSMKSASKSNKNNGYNHRWFWTELRANKSAKKYYNSYFGVDWSIYENNIYSKYYYPTVEPQAEEVKAYIKILLNK